MNLGRIVTANRPRSTFKNKPAKLISTCFNRKLIPMKKDGISNTSCYCTSCGVDITKINP